MRVSVVSRTVVVVLVLALLAGMLAGCGAFDGADEESVSRDDYGVSTAPSAPEASEQLTEEAAPGAKTADGDRMIIRTQTLRLEVESTPDAIESLRTLAEDHSAVITDLQVATETDEWLYRYDDYGYSTGDALRGWMTVRVPAESLDAFVDASMKLGDVKYQSEGSQDVTQEHVDLSARLQNLRAEEERLRSFFDAAADVEDMLAIEAELNRIRQEIESLDAQVQYLERQAAMATVTIELTEEEPVVRPEGDSWGFSDAITAGFQGAAAVVKFVIAFLIATAPLWIFGIIAFFVVRAIVKRRRAARSDAQQ